MEPSVLNIVLVVLVIAAIWAVVELALAFRRARTSVEELTRSANETIEQVQPIIAKVDGMVDDLQPGVSQVDPMVAQAGEVLETAQASLDKVNTILGDVSEVSGTAAAVTGTVNRVADSAAAGVSGVISKLAGSGKQDSPSLPKNAESPVHGEGPADKGYVTYGQFGADVATTAQTDRKDAPAADASGEAK